MPCISVSHPIASTRTCLNISVSHSHRQQPALFFHLAISPLSHTHPYVHVFHLKNVSHTPWCCSRCKSASSRGRGLPARREDVSDDMEGQTWMPFLGRHRWGKLDKSVGAQKRKKELISDIWGKRGATYGENDALESFTSSSPTTYSPRIDAGGQPKRPSFGVRT